jgi:hemoglobin/transferrin/lactoferrin receptor protein
MKKAFMLMALVYICHYTYAQTDTLEEKTLDNLVISANKWEQKLNEVPNKIVKINKFEILRNNPQTSADLLGQSGSVFIQKSQLGGGSPMIRGFATNRVLLVADGVRMNNAIYRSGNLQNVISIDPLSVESAEVIFGPGSLIYGSDAIGGVMDFHTLEPRFSTDKKHWQKEVYWVVIQQPTKKKLSMPISIWVGKNGRYFLLFLTAILMI